MSDLLRVVQYGLGPIGLEALKLAAAKPWIEILGGIDIDPAKVGRDLGELTGLPQVRGRPVVRTWEDLPATTAPDLVLHTTVSSFPAACAQLLPLARRGLQVVSSCEEMVFPQLRHPELAAELDAACRAGGARMIGTGVNPGFVMDLLPVCLTGVSRSVRAVHIQRVVDAATRREPLQRKIGSGQAPAAFRERLAAGRAGHAGLRESLALVAHSLGWQVEAVVETGEPVVATRDIRTQFLTVAAGETCGIHQRAEAQVAGRTCLTLDLQMYLGAPEPHDAIQIAGEPPVDVLIRGGVAGDQATVAVLVNTARRLATVPPGLKLVTDLPVPRWA